MNLSCLTGMPGSWRSWISWLRGRSQQQILIQLLGAIACLAPRPSEGSLTTLALLFTFPRQAQHGQEEEGIQAHSPGRDPIRGTITI